jgi:ATP adenylyltransferase
MKQLWAPWRLEYIRGKDEEKGCIFCIPECLDEDAKRLIIHRGRFAFVIMNRFPYSNGHLMVAPYRHCGNIDDLEDDEILEIHRLLVLSRQALVGSCQPHGFNIGLNLGHSAGAGIADHVHYHIVPRWHGDTNFMSLFADVRVIPEHLEATFRRIKTEFERSTGQNPLFHLAFSRVAPFSNAGLCLCPRFRNRRAVGGFKIYRKRENP